VTWSLAICRKGRRGAHLLASLSAALYLATVNAKAQDAQPVPNVASQAAQRTASASDLDRAYALLQAGKLEESVAAFEQILTSDPDNRTARLELGYLKARLRDWPDAVRYLKAVSQKEPQNLRLRMDLGYALQHVGQIDGAMEHFRAVADQPGELQSQAQGALETLRQLKLAQVSQRDAFLNTGYAQLREGNRAAARESFERALAEDPDNVTILAEIGYLALAEGNLTLAVERFEAARRYATEDYSLLLQLGYVYDRLHETAEAEDAFRGALASPDPRLRRDAQAALKNLPSANLQRVYLDVLADPFYATRFSNGVADFDAQLHWRPKLRGPVSLYLGSHLTRDSRSQGGSLPAIFSDNVGLFGLGVDLQPRGWNLKVRAEANLAFNLVMSPVRNRSVEPDYRVVLSYYRGWTGRLWGPIGLATFGQIRSERLFSDLDTSAGYYSRYQDNGLAYLQVRDGLRLADWGPSRFGSYIILRLAKDTNRDFFNNVGEIGPGLEFRPYQEFNLSFRAEYLRGVYYGIHNTQSNPFGPNYGDFRLTLLLGHRFYR
jgi:Flp pilus assembly protein TadD